MSLMTARRAVSEGTRTRAGTSAVDSIGVSGPAKTSSWTWGHSPAPSFRADDSHCLTNPPSSATTSVAPPPKRARTPAEGSGSASTRRTNAHRFRQREGDAFGRATAEAGAYPGERQRVRVDALHHCQQIPPARVGRFRAGDPGVLQNAAEHQCPVACAVAAIAHRAIRAGLS